MQNIPLELLCSISSFSGCEKTGVKVVSLHFAWFYFCILTVGFKVRRIPHFRILGGDRFHCGVSRHMIKLDFYKTRDGTKQFWGD